MWSWSATAWAGCAISFLYESKLAAEVRGVILDAPGVDLGAIVDHGARGRTLPLLGLPVPAPLTATAKAVAGWSHSVTSSGRGRGVTRGRGSMRAWRLDLVRFR